MKQIKKKIAITGGIASGKTQVTQYLESLHYLVLDSDAIYKELARKGGKIYEALLDAYGGEIILSDGQVDWKKMGDLVFSDEKELERLNSLTHPLIYQEIEERINSLSEKNIKDSLLFIDIPLLFESYSYASKIDFSSIWLVYTSPDKQIARLMQRNQLTRKEALARIEAQMSFEEKRKRSNEILVNNSTREDLFRKVDQLIQKYKEDE